MCRLFSYSSRSPESDNAMLVEALVQFRAWTRTGVVPKGVPEGHRDGWGMSIYKNGACVLYTRSVTSADDDPQFDTILDAIRLIQPDAVIAHLRKASVGVVTVENAHPFLFDSLSFCHNGSVTIDPSKSLCDGASDTRTLFHELATTPGDPFVALRTMAERIRATGEYTSFTTLLSDGVRTHASLDYNPEHPLALERGFDTYYTLFETRTPTAHIVSSQPLVCEGGTSVQMQNRSQVEILL